MRTPLRAVSRLAFAGALALAGLNFAPAAVRAAVPTEKSLPATTIAFAKVDSVAKLRAAFGKSQLGQLLDDPAMKPLKDDLAAKLDGASDKLKEAVGITLGELAEIPQGAASLAILARDDEKIPMAVLLSADAGSKADRMNEVLTRTTEQAEKEGSKISSETFKGLKLTIIQSTKEEEKDNPPLVWTRQESIFHVASDADALKDLLAHADGRDDSLASTEDFNAVAKKVAKDAQGFWFLDLSQAIKLGAQVAGAQGANAEQIVAQIQLTGLNGLKAVGGSVAFDVGEYDVLTKIFVLAPGPAQGVLKLFSLPPADLKPQPWVPSSADSYQTFSWDLDNAYTALKDLADTYLPGQIENIESSLSGPDGEKISFQKDLFGPLGDRITVVSDFKQPAKEGNERVLFAVALEDQKAFQTTFNKLLAIAGLSPEKREFQGTTIYDFDLSNFPNPAGNLNVEGTLSVAIAKDHLFGTTEPSLLEQVLRPGGPGLSESADFQAVARQFPGQTITSSYTKPEESARLLYDMVKSGELNKAMAGLKKEGEADEAPAIDPEKIPDFSVFAKYLGQGGGFGVAEEDGATFTQFTLKKANP